MVENKEVIAKNIKRYMELRGVNSAEVCKALGFKQNTFSNWINARIYPRIDKIEKLANYFNVSKADLVEEYPVVISANDETANRLIRYAGMLNELSPKARAEAFNYIEYLRSKEV